ncbi:ATP-grasp domain-containing protein [Rhizobium alarense]|uniref:hypothetical protein n=1 Tax=Rhizobium alarense TaxID=2846851 RepID=UPI0038B535DC
MQVHDDYCAMLHAVLTGIERRHGAFVVIDVHSYNHRLGGPTAPVTEPASAPDINPAKDDVRWNMSAAGAATKVDITPPILAIAEMVRPKLVTDGMFLVGVDIVSDKILEINVFTPGGLPGIAELYGVDLAPDVIIALERKMEMRRNYAGRLSNRTAATL